MSVTPRATNPSTPHRRLLCLRQTAVTNMFQGSRGAPLRLTQPVTPSWRADAVSDKAWTAVSPAVLTDKPVICDLQPAEESMSFCCGTFICSRRAPHLFLHTSLPLKSRTQEFVKFLCHGASFLSLVHTSCRTRAMLASPWILMWTWCRFSVAFMRKHFGTLAAKAICKIYNIAEVLQDANGCIFYTAIKYHTVGEYYWKHRDKFFLCKLMPVHSEIRKQISDEWRQVFIFLASAIEHVCKYDKSKK